MRKGRLSTRGGLILGLLILSGCGTLYESLEESFLQQQNAAAAAAAEFAADNPSFLYVLTGTDGTLVADPATADGYTLTLHGLVGNVISFSDRPERIASHETLADFVADWTAVGFTEDPPNAALVLHAEDESQDVIVVELRDPVYDANGDTLTFSAVVLTEGPTGALAEYFEKADAVLPAAFGTCSLLIDNAEEGCTVSITGDNPVVRDVRIAIVMRNGRLTNMIHPLYYGYTVDLGDNVTSFMVQVYSAYYFITCPNDGQSYTLTLQEATGNHLPAGFTFRRGE